MTPKEMNHPMAGGTMYFSDKTEEIDKIEWVPHPKFEGAFMKHLITKADNDQLASCHLVRINPGYQLSDHIHENEWEYHHTIEGSGTGYLDGKEMPYTAGKIAVIPKGVTHRVVAGDEGIVILATFLPGLV